MPQLELEGRKVEVDHEGFLLDPDDWSRAYAQLTAQQLGLPLTDRHWQVIDFCRADFKANGQSPGPRRITKYGGFPTKELYQLFPNGPGKFAAKLAGLRKPTMCV
jgi:TusE/DsrC/DsvC family sulfur relay protein